MDTQPIQLLCPEGDKMFQQGLQSLMKGQVLESYTMPMAETSKFDKGLRSARFILMSKDQPIAVDVSYRPYKVNLFDTPEDVADWIWVKVFGGFRAGRGAQRVVDGRLIRKPYYKERYEL